MYVYAVKLCMLPSTDQPGRSVVETPITSNGQTPLQGYMMVIFITKPLY